jgi:outer membrane immunogenic protein
MKNGFKTAIGAVLGVVTWQSAYAADLPVKAPPPAVVAPAPTWTGCYIGGNVGATWGGGEINTNVGTASGSSNGASFAGGGQIGCDYQTGQFVFGLRNMFDWSSRSRSFRVPAGAFAGFAGEARNDWIDLLTGRVGWAVQPNWLLYFQGGGAWRESSLHVFNPAGVDVGTADRTRTGWTVGGGTEWRFAPNWSAFVEYDYAEFGSRTVAFTSPVLGTLTASAKSNTQLFLVGVNWRFSGGY